MTLYLQASHNLANASFCSMSAGSLLSANLSDYRFLLPEEQDQSRSISPMYYVGERVLRPLIDKTSAIGQAILKKAADGFFNLGLLCYKGWQQLPSLHFPLAVNAEPNSYETPVFPRYSEQDTCTNGAVLQDGSGEYEKGLSYEKGNGVIRDIGKAFQFYTIGAKKGHVPSQISLARFHILGWGTPVDCSKALSIIKGLKDSPNYSMALSLRALCYLYGFSKDGKYYEDFDRAFRDLTTSFQIDHNPFAEAQLAFFYLKTEPEKAHLYASNSAVGLEKLADEGDPFAQELVGAYYLSGLGGTRDIEKGLKWETRSARQGWWHAQHLLGELYLEGRGVPKDAKKAFKWFEKAAIQGNASAQIVIADMYINGKGVSKDTENGFKWLEKAAIQGNVSAQFLIASMYLNGKGVSKDIEKGFKWMEKAAIQGNAKAQLSLSLLYSGIGNWTDNRKAIYWLEKAAIQGDAEAQFYMGNFYSSGVGCPIDHVKAIEWYTKSANQQFIHAQIELGDHYAKGIGVTQDYRRAVEWFVRAFEQGSIEAKHILDKLRR